MEAVIVLIGALVFLAVIVGLGRGKTVVSVNDQVSLSSSPEQVERSCFGALGTIPQASLTSVVPGQLTLESKWAPTWVIVLGILSFPLGLLLILLVRQSLVLHVRFLPEGAGTLVQVSGKTRRKVAVAVGEAVESVG